MSGPLPPLDGEGERPRCWTDQNQSDRVRTPRTLQPVTVLDLLPPHLLVSGLTRLIATFLSEVALGLARFRRGGLYFNAPATESLSILNQLARLLRFTLLMAACVLDLPAGRLRHATRPRAAAKTWRPPDARFRLFPAYRISSEGEDPRPVPKGFAGAARDPILIAERKRALLARVLADPAPFVESMARRLPRQLMVIGWRPPKRPPRRHRDLAETIATAWREAWFQLREFRRRTRDSADPQASAT